MNTYDAKVWRGRFFSRGGVKMDSVSQNNLLAAIELERFGGASWKLEDWVMNL